MGDMRQNLFELVQIPGPSGFENDVAKYIKKEIEPFISRIDIDGMGNLLAKKEGPEEAPIFLLMAHMDEVSMVTTYVKDSFVRFDYVGTINPSVAVGQPMLVITKERKIPGVVCSPSVHLSQTVGDLWLDVGSRGNFIEPGDPIIFDTKPRWLDDREKILASKSIDDRAGCAVLLDVARKLRDTSLKINLIFAFTVQEEVGSRGAEYVARHLHPAWAIAVDTSYAIDAFTDETKAIPLGEGPLIRKFESAKPGRGMAIQFADQQLVEALRLAEKEINIPVKVDARFNLYTDSSGVYEAFSDVKCTSVTIPRRYSHSPYEVIHLDSLEKTSSILTQYFKSNWEK
jgi:endoglucanase